MTSDVQSRHAASQENFYRHDERKLEIYQSNIKADFKQDLATMPVVLGGMIGAAAGMAVGKSIGGMRSGAATGKPVGKPVGMAAACMINPVTAEMLIGDFFKERDPMENIFTSAKKYVASFVGKFIEPIDDVRSQIDKLKQIVTFEDDADKKLAEMEFAPKIVPLLEQTLEQLKKIFPTDTEYSLCKSPDPSDRGFVLDIWTHGDCDEIMTYMSKFRKDWWIDHMPDSVDLLIIGAHRR